MPETHFLIGYELQRNIEKVYLTRMKTEHGLTYLQKGHNQVQWLSLHMSKVAHQAGAYPGFCSMKRLGVSLLPLGWDASPSQGYPRIKFADTHSYFQTHCESKMSCPGTQHNVPG